MCPWRCGRARFSADWPEWGGQDDAPEDSFAHYKAYDRLGGDPWPSSLLEVGTCFHPELRGRKNTFLSGAILGMRKRGIARKLDEIVTLAELVKFIDTPVKHYRANEEERSRALMMPEQFLWRSGPCR
jgi:hypothetical protein